MNILENLQSKHLHPSQMQIAIAILSVYNCRAGEVLSAEWANFHPNKFLILKGEKNSGSVIIRDRLILSAINDLPRLNKQLIFSLLTYSKLYHYCKKHYSHLFIKFKGRKNYKVTHGFRYSAVEFVDNEVYIRDVLFHRSKSSGRFYKLKKKGLNNG